jgi:hypothetical protein
VSNSRDISVFKLAPALNIGSCNSLQVNALATGLLSLLLLPLLSKTGTQHPESKPHLTILGSEG